MECKICWTPYDPADGDETRQIPPNTPFLALPADWKCPTCDAPKEQFMVLSDDAQATAEAPKADNHMPDAIAALEAEFLEIHNAKMRNVPFANKALNVQAVGFGPWQGHYLGVLIAPWFMNLTILPGPGTDWSGLTTGDTELIDLPSGTYEFIHTVRPGMGGYKSCSLFSPMAEFNSQLQATDVARAVMTAVFDRKNRAETDQSVAIRKQREAELAPPPAEAPQLQAPPILHPAPNRRAVLTGGLAQSGDSAE